MIDGLSKLQSQQAAALRAGYAPSVARHAGRILQGVNVRSAFQDIAQAWCDPEKVGQRIAEGLDAMESKFFQFEGGITDRADVISWSERRQYAELAARVCGYHVDKQEVEVKHGLSADTASKELDELLASIAARADKQSKSGRASKAN